MTEKNVDLFSEFRNKNIRDETIREHLETTLQNHDEINKIEKYGRNLLLTACLYDNDNVFKYLSTHYKEQFKNDFKQCVLLTYSNKNPNILEIALSNLGEQNDDEKVELCEKISKYCFRDENISITQEWFKNNLNKEQAHYFVSRLVKYNNKPFLNHISNIPFWNQLLKNNAQYQSTSCFTTLQSITETQQANIDSLDTNIDISFSTDSTEKKKDLVIVRKRPRASSLRNNP